ncbi:MAG TPA: HAMP domain-containing sensor histidine kinase [Gemmatimonadales bacterium]|nr:HAMP domain-containing sensor histidine kinase [Gemmatimonadales bacterium]
MGAPDDGPAIHEILRQASVALGGRPVTLWEAVAPDRFDPRAGSHSSAPQAPGVDLYATIERWRIPVAPASRWVGSRAWDEGPWVIAPVRVRPPAPPPQGRERRSRERMTLELAGLCLGLSRRAAQPDPLADLASLPAMIAHEASNPLAAARAALQLAMETLGKWTDLDADRRRGMVEELGLVVGDIDRAVSFLRAIQDRARGAFGRHERFDVVRVVRSCLTLEHPVLRQRGIEVRLESPVDSLYLKGDPNDLFDLLVNLLRNAADASEGRARPIEVRLDRDGETLRLAVRDGGTGIRAEHLERIFEPGFTTKEFGKGSGMGLAVVRRVAAQFGGTVSVESQPGRGSEFTVRLPVPPQRKAGEAG